MCMGAPYRSSVKSARSAIYGILMRSVGRSLGHGKHLQRPELSHEHGAMPDGHRRRFRPAPCLALAMARERRTCRSCAGHPRGLRRRSITRARRGHRPAMARGEEPAASARRAEPRSERAPRTPPRPQARPRSPHVASTDAGGRTRSSRPIDALGPVESSRFGQGGEPRPHGRGANAMSPMPAMHTAAPMASQRSGRWPSTSQSQETAVAT